MSVLLKGGFSFELSREVVGQCILATKDSRPGPDGVPYAAWRGAGELAAGVVHEALCAVLEGGEDLPEQFNDAWCFSRRAKSRLGPHGSPSRHLTLVLLACLTPIRRSLPR